jgi:hypothetical protein
MNIQSTARIPTGVLHHKVVLRQSPPAPVAFTAASDTQTIFLFGIPAKHVVVGIVAKLVVTFAATGLSNCTVSIGSTSQVNGVITSINFLMPNFVCTQSVTPTSPFMYWSPFTVPNVCIDPQDIYATFTSTGAQLATLTAGELEITVMYRAF